MDQGRDLRLIRNTGSVHPTPFLWGIRDARNVLAMGGHDGFLHPVRGLTMQRLFLCVLLLAGVIICRDAHGQDRTCSSSSLVITSECPDQGTAYAAANAVAAELVTKANTGASGWCYAPPWKSTTTSYQAYVTPCSSPATAYNTRTRTYPPGTECSKRSEHQDWKGGPTAGSVGVCNEGCTYTSSLDAASPNGITFSPTGQVCRNEDIPPPEIDPGDGGEGGGGDDGGGGGGDTGGGDGGDGGGDGDGGGSGDGGGEGGGGGGGGDGEGGDGDGDGDGDGGGTGDPGGEQPNVPSPEYPGDIPMPWAEGTIPSSPDGQWSSGLGGGSCPASKSVAVGLGGVSTTVNFSFQPLCDFATLIRGLVLACAAIASAYIIAGVRK